MSCEAICLCKIEKYSASGVAIVKKVAAGTELLTVPGSIAIWDGD
jgi:hypothetical protein